MNNPVASVLKVLLVISLVLSVLFCLQYIMVTREARTISSQMANINLFRNTLQALANDCLAYSQTNPAINPILESVGLKPRSGATGSNPGGKSASNR
jgi:predicted PurR-regulated permease PerM